jgi:hypothetical protein
MNWADQPVIPAARSDGLVVERFDDETLIYDLEHDKVHHLNPTAAAVFELCDGRTRVAALAAAAAERLGQPVTQQTVCDAVELLAARRLLTGALEIDAGVSRREVVRKAALAGAGAAVAAPVIKSIVAPTPAQAQSPCVNPKTCTVNEDCCPNFFCGHGICFPT